MSFNIRFVSFIMLIQLLVYWLIYNSILYLNGGHFVYTLDDPYIFFAMAKNHFISVTHGVIANASSSLLGLYALTLFLPYFGVQYALYLNIFFSLLTTIVFWKTLSLFDDQVDNNKLFKAFFLIDFIVITNQAYLVFTGMEHTVQIFLCTVIYYGLLKEIQTKTIPYWLILSLILLPLWRYDCLGIFSIFLIYLFFKNHVKVGVFCFTTVAVILGAYFVSWKSISPFYFPTSLMVKSVSLSSINQYVNSHFTLTESVYLLTISVMLISIFLYFISHRLLPYKQIFYKYFLCLFSVVLLIPLFARHFNSHPFILLVLMMLLVYLILKAKFSEPDYFIAMIVMQLFISVVFIEHVSAARISAYWNVIAMTGLYAFFIEKKIFFNGRNTFIQAGCFSLLLYVWGFNHTMPLYYIEYASSSIYRQQYQMARFVRDFYKAPVAVNDIGLVAYQNTTPIIDLCALGTPEIIQKNKRMGSLGCYTYSVDERILKKNKVNLIMLYHGFSWFLSVPKDYRPIAVLHLIPPSCSVGMPDVTFYATYDSYNQTYTQLEAFKKTLPKGVKLLMRTAQSAREK